MTKLQKNNAKIFISKNFAEKRTFISHILWRNAQCDGREKHELVDLYVNGSIYAGLA